MKLPQSPKTPGIVQLFQWIADPLGLMDDCAKRYGDMFTLRVGTNCRPIVFLTNPQAIKEVFTADYKQFASSKANELAKPLVGQNSLFLMDGDRHKRERQLLMPPFHGEKIRSYGKLIKDITLAVTKDWQSGQTFIVRDVMQEITLGVILRAVFGLDEGERNQKLRHLLCEMLDNISSPLNSALLFFPQLQKDLGAWSPWSKFLRRQEQITELLMAEIQERRNNFDPSRSDILSLLMSAKDEAGNPMTDAELHDELLTLLVAGHETTATSLAWALYSIHHVPGVLDKLLHEIDSLGENPDPNIIAKLPYLTAVCNETLRLYPILFITFGRIAQSPVKIMDRDFEVGTSIAPCIYLTHRREDLYPEPEKFKPERFLERQFSPYEFLPFGGGTRRCIGIALAPYEMKIVLATILANWQLSLAEKTPVRPIRRGFTLGPKGGVKMLIKNQCYQPVSV